jgi:hypothetical protein
MKKLVLSVVAAMSIVTAVSGANVSADSIESALKDGKFSVNSTFMYYERDYDTKGKSSSIAMTFSDVLKYTTKEYKGLTVGLAHWGSNKIAGLYSEEDGIGTYNVAADGSNINLLGEAYLEYNHSNTMIKVGRQTFYIPLFVSFETRTLGAVFEAVTIANRDIPNTLIQAGYVKSMTALGCFLNDFKSIARWGENGFSFLYLTNQSIKGLKIRAAFAKTMEKHDDSSSAAYQISNYRYSDALYKVPVGKKTYVKVQYGGNKYFEKQAASGASADSLMLGVKVGTSVGMADLALVGSSITENTFRVLKSAPMVTDWLQGYGTYEPSTAYGVETVIHPMDNLSIKAGWVKVMADEDFRIDNTFTDSFTETRADVKYKINNYSSARVEYSMKDQDKDSDTDSQNEVRVSYKIKF